MQTKLKKLFFFIVTFLIPVLFFVLLELSLRLIGAGGDEKLIVKIKENGKEFYQLNQNVGKRYFVRTDASMIPQLYPQRFPVKKSPRTIRIFLLGGSTMAGFPYELNARINSLLKDRLSVYFPKKNVEVINFGLSAVNSFTVLDFAREIVDYQPDLAIIYMGHNEFYGAFGVGSLEQFAKNPRWVRFYLRLRRFRTFLLLRSAIAKIYAKTRASDQNYHQTLMEKIAKKKAIPVNSADYRLACRYFRENLDEIISTIQKKKIHVFVSTLTSNLKDQFPFVSLFSDSIPREQKAAWEKAFHEADEEFKNTNYRKCFQYLQQCREIDSRPAKLHFLLGKYFFANRDTLHARQEFIYARDGDALRFRAPSIFNEIIEQVAAEHKTPVIPMDSVFNASSPEKIVGYGLITEHLHPNIRGFEIMAKAFAKTFVQQFPLNEPPRNLSFSDEYFQQKAAITIFDEAIGDVTIQKLTSRWPYRHKRNLIQYENSADKEFVESLVKKYQSKEISWNQAHYSLADYFIQKSQFEKALREYLAVIKVVPKNYYPHFKIANLFFAQNKFAEAAEWYKKALLRNNKPFVKAKLGMVYLNMSKFAEAEKIFLDAIRQEEHLKSLSPAESSLLYYYFALSQIQLGKQNSAREPLQKALQFNPNNAEARQLLKLLKSNKRLRIKF
ncbi:MAG: tetratricopeptide repeat protein [Calditrichaeota bacterium]|nr:tetratricopeptide repeat protein [Calditrichota bacterium]